MDILYSSFVLLSQKTRWNGCRKGLTRQKAFVIARGSIDVGLENRKHVFVGTIIQMVDFIAFI
jgi:hypothetical protein